MAICSGSYSSSSSGNMNCAKPNQRCITNSTITTTITITITITTTAIDNTACRYLLCILYLSTVLHVCEYVYRQAYSASLLAIGADGNVFVRAAVGEAQAGLNCTLPGAVCRRRRRRRQEAGRKRQRNILLHTHTGNGAAVMDYIDGKAALIERARREREREREGERGKTLLLFFPEWKQEQEWCCHSSHSPHLEQSRAEQSRAVVCVRPLCPYRHFSL